VAHRPDSLSAPGAAPPAFQVTDLHRHFRLEKHRIEVLRGVSFTVAAGEWVALVGRSGSGKTTLLHLLSGLDRPSRGDVLCLGHSFRGMSEAQRTRLRLHHVGHVFQSYHLFPELNAHENVMLPALHWGWDRRRACERAAELLAGFGLGERLRHRPQELSGGEQQRVALARALMNEPGIILADEPTGNLDLAAGREIIALLEELHTAAQKTIVMVTHDLDLAQRADRILVMRDGRAMPVPPGSRPDLGPPPLRAAS
jgi:predicted ABC-type transport system involved in lysophospholipase L1 biosynthesis ATPase subunit